MKRLKLRRGTRGRMKVIDAWLKGEQEVMEKGLGEGERNKRKGIEGNKEGA